MEELFKKKKLNFTEPMHVSKYKWKKYEIGVLSQLLQYLAIVP